MPTVIWCLGQTHTDHHPATCHACTPDQARKATKATKATTKPHKPLFGCTNCDFKTGDLADAMWHSYGCDREFEVEYGQPLCNDHAVLGDGDMIAALQQENRACKRKLSLQSTAINCNQLQSTAIN